MARFLIGAGSQQSMQESINAPRCGPAEVQKAEQSSHGKGTACRSRRVRQLCCGLARLRRLLYALAFSSSLLCFVFPVSCGSFRFASCQLHFFWAELLTWLHMASTCLACCRLTGCNWRGNLLDVSRPTLGSVSFFPVSATPGSASPLDQGAEDNWALLYAQKLGAWHFLMLPFIETFEIRCLRQACYSKAFGLIVSDKVTGHDVMHRFWILVDIDIMFICILESRIHSVHGSPRSACLHVTLATLLMDPWLELQHFSETCLFFPNYC